MTRSAKAALLSGLVFPGLGHLVLKHYFRGAVLIVLAVIAISIVVNAAVKQALFVVERISGGEITADVGEITQMIANSTAGGQESILNIAILVFAGCWVFGIVDSCRLGKKQTE